MHKRTDTNQKQIVDVLRSMGCSVFVLSKVGHGCPDLMAGTSGINILIEVKDGTKPPSQRKLTADEQKFHDEWQGWVTIVKSVTEAIDLVNRVRRRSS